MKRIIEHDIPHVYITNGGGMTEETKAKDMTEKFQIDVNSSQVILSHTPMKNLVEEYKDKRVLIIGSRGYMEVASHYGFKNCVNAHQLHQQNPGIYPSRNPHHEHHQHQYEQHNATSTSASPTPPESTTTSPDSTGTSGIDAVLVLHDPLDWALEMQVLSDVLLGNTNNTPNMVQTIPLYVCNADIVYMDQYHHPRYTQGAFVEAFRGLFGHYTKSPLNVDYCGKPYSIQYKTAEEALKKQSNGIDIYYGIGDNPKADIRGANNAGENWVSVLVKTGVHQMDSNDTIDVADILTQDIDTALDIIIEKHSNCNNHNNKNNNSNI